MKRISEYARFMALSDEEKDREVAKYDREIPLSETRPLTAADRVRLRKARKRGLATGWRSCMQCRRPPCG